MYIYKIMYTSIKYLYIGILFSYLATVVIQFFIYTVSLNMGCTIAADECVINLEKIIIHLM